MDDCIFCQISRGELTANFLYQDEDVMAFPDVHPVKPTHILVVPKKHVKEYMAIEDIALFTKLGIVVQRMIREHDLEGRGYQITINGGGSQEVDHLHIHVMGPMIGKTKMM